MSARGPAGPFAAVAGGVILAGSVVAPWVRQVATRNVGGVPIAEQATSPGTEFAGEALLVALAALLIGLAALLAPAARRVLGAVLWLAAFPACAMVLWGVTLARDTGGSLTSAPFLAFTACLLISYGAMAMRSRAATSEPVLDQRYTVEGGAAEDDEWRLSAEEPDEAP